VAEADQDSECRAALLAPELTVQYSLPGSNVSRFGLGHAGEVESWCYTQECCCSIPHSQCAISGIRVVQLQRNAAPTSITYKKFVGCGITINCITALGKHCTIPPIPKYDGHPVELMFHQDRYPRRWKVIGPPSTRRNRPRCRLTGQVTFQYCRALKSLWELNVEFQPATWCSKV
jgi:hypothetical protein